MTVLVLNRYSLVQPGLVLRATQKLQEQSLAAKLSYQAGQAFEVVLGVLREIYKEHGLQWLNVRQSIEWQGSRARSLGKRQEPGRSQVECRITDIMLNADQAVFPGSDPYPPQKQPADPCICNKPGQECLSL